MIDLSQAFSLGYAVPIIGIHFNNGDLLAKLAPNAAGLLAERVEQHVQAFQGRARGVIDNVRRVEGWLKESQIAVGPPPRLPEDYYTWADKIDRACSTRFDADLTPIDSARLIGWTIGDALLTLNCGVIVEHLLEAAPDNSLLVAQADHLATDQARLLERLRRVDDEWPLERGRDAMARLRAAFVRAPKIGAGDHAAAVAALQDAMREMATEVPALEGAFAGQSPQAPRVSTSDPQIIEEEGVAFMYAPQIAYLRVDVKGMVPAKDLPARLDHPKLWSLVAHTERRGVLLNFAQAWRFGTEDLEWIAESWIPKARAAGIERVSIVVQGQVMDLFGAIFPPAVEKARAAGVDLRAFRDAQFYENMESVSWMEG